MHFPNNEETRKPRFLRNFPKAATKQRSIFHLSALNRVLRFFSEERLKIKVSDDFSPKSVIES